MTANELQGTWRILHAELGGAKAPAFVVERTELRLTRDRYRVVFAGETADQGTFQLGQSGEVQTIRLTSTFGERDGREMPSLIQVKGDLMRICFGSDGVLPTAFASPVGSTAYLVTYRRSS
ncbi:TIGR03067 domain-containing protein [Nibricoccus sp. IMCC34717]|uniref:TIGR03067 domain-containing protein n=1 Tax=Nibricoccus sp. IMCC34717 TaxID=3034021 RepID=UPI00384CC794